MAPPSLPPASSSLTIPSFAPRVDITSIPEIFTPLAFNRTSFNCEIPKPSSLSSDTPFNPLIFSRYPRNLPPLPLLFYLIDIFFVKVPTIPKMLNKVRLRSVSSPLLNVDRLTEPTRFLRRSSQTHFLTCLRTLPPTHPSFPSSAILHAIIALSTRHCGREDLKDSFSSAAPSLDTLGTDGLNIFEAEMESFRGKHARFAQEEMEKEVARGTDLFEVVVGQS